MPVQKITTAMLTEFLDENVKDLVGTMPWMKEKKMELCRSITQLKEFVDRIIQKGIGALDTETTGLNTRIDSNGKPYIKTVGISLAISPIEGIYIPMNHTCDPELNINEKEVWKEIDRLCKNSVIILHNAKYDLAVLKNEGIIVDDFEKYEDTLLMAYLYDAGQKGIGLKDLSDKLLKQPMIDFDKITGGSGKFNIISPEIGYVYAASDAICTYGLYEFFLKQKTFLDQKSIYNLEKRVVFVVMQMEANLVSIDKEYLISEKARISIKLEEIRKEVTTLAGEEFNVASTQQLGKILFEKLKYRYPEKEKTKSGQYKTDTSTLEKIQDEYPIVKKLVQFRTLEKILGTYIENLINNCDENSCVKLGFKQTGTETGRFSCPGGYGLLIDGYSAVNVQSIPSNYDETIPDVRRAFRARPGLKIVAMDFSGEELRVAANLSKEKKWVDEFLYGDADLHTVTAMTVYKKNKEDITKLERGKGKLVNFLVMYGGGPRGLSEQAHVSENEARRMLIAFFEGLPQLDKWIKKERAIAKEKKFARTALGRIRPLHMFYDSGDRGQEAHADRCATNFLVQGLSADIMKTAMVRVAGWIKSNHLEDEIRMIITVHDEIVFEIKEDKLSEHIPALKKIMCLNDILQGLLKWPVPLTLDAEYGDTWHVTNNFFEEHPELIDASPEIKFHSQEQIPTTPVIIETNAFTTPVTENTKDTLGVVNAETNPIIVDTEKEIIDSTSTETESTVEIPKETTGELIYQVNKLNDVTSRKLNDILDFLDRENSCDAYSSVKKTLKLCNKDGEELLVSDVSVFSDAFIALAHYEGL